MRLTDKRSLEFLSNRLIYATYPVVKLKKLRLTCDGHIYGIGSNMETWETLSSTSDLI